ncbi:MAG: DUF5717 family protein, partial [Lachnospiraceae bacterium]|nr:DUF5717 family protein [Lachnospiraceae bacterium]
VLETNGIKSWVREKAVEQILDYHYEEQAMEELGECLDQINYKVISPSYRRTLMNYYMACNRMEDAYFGIELYGSDLVDTEQLYLLTCVGLYLHKGQKDELLLIMAHRTFINGKYNDEVLHYLEKYLEGRLFDLLVLWEVLKKKNLDTVEYEEKLIEQMLFTGESDERMLDVLLSYLSKKENNALMEALMELYCQSCFFSGRKLPDSFFTLLDRQAKTGNPLSVPAMLSYLQWKAQTGFEPVEEERIRIRGYLKQLCAKGIVFTFYEAFEEIFSLPPIFVELTWISYYGKPERKTEAEFIIQNDKNYIRQQTVALAEVYPGFYFGSIFLFDEEKGKVYVSQEEENTVEKMVRMEQFDTGISWSRKEILNRMKEEKLQAGFMGKHYDETLLELKEQLFMLP